MEIKRYIALIWRWGWLIILGTFIAGGTAYIISRNSTRIYSASSRLLIDEAPGSGGGNDYSQILLEQRLAQTYVEILATQPVLQETIDRLDLPLSTDQLKRMVTVSALQDTQIIIIGVEDTDPLRAAEIVNTLGDVFIAQNRARESLRYAEPILNGQTRLEEIGNEIEALDTEIRSFGVAESAEKQSALSRLETQLKETQFRYTETFDNLNALQIDQAKESSNVVKIEAAQAKFTPIRPRTISNSFLAALVGGLLALGVIFFIEYVDDTVKSPEQISEDTNLTTLSAIAFIKGGDLSERVVSHLRPRDPISEAYRVMRTNLNFAAVDEGLRSILISSSSPGEGKSTTTANLGVVMAQTGKKVVVVDADLRRPIQHKIFGVPNNQGLTTAILDNSTPISDHIQNSKIQGLRVLASGPIPPNPAELLNSQRMSHIVDMLKAEADVIIFDTPPTLTVADASILAPQVDGCVLVVEAGRTRRATFVQAVERLDKANANIFGVTMNRLKPSRSGYYENYYYYHYYNNNYSRRRSHKHAGQMRLPNWLTSLSKR